MPSMSNEPKGKILVVEDNDFVRMQMVKFLNDGGFATAESKDGWEALSALSADTSAAVIDMRMQPMDGLEFIQRLHGFNKKIPVIVVTGYDTAGLQREPALWNASAILSKPVPRDELLAAVERALE